MSGTNTVGVVRKFITRTLAAGTLLGIYAIGTITTTGAMLTATSTSAEAYYRGRGWRGRGWRGRGWRGRGYYARGWRGRGYGYRRGWRGRGYW
jgi:hypothetical protein